MEAALLQAVVPRGGDGAQGSGNEAMSADMAVVFPSYSLTDVDGVVHTCTVSKGTSTTTRSSRPTPCICM